MEKQLYEQILAGVKSKESLNEAFDYPSFPGLTKGNKKDYTRFVRDIENGVLITDHLKMLGKAKLKQMLTLYRKEMHNSPKGMWDDFLFSGDDDEETIPTLKKLGFADLIAK